MTAKLTPITCEPPGENIEQTLLDALEMHRKGELSAIALAVVYRDGSTGNAFSRLPSHATMLGAVARLQYRLNQKMDE